MMDAPQNTAAGLSNRRLLYYTLGFIRSPRIRAILRSAGYRPVFGYTARPREGDVIGVWGHSPYAKRGEAMAQKTGLPIVRIEDAPLRSLHLGRSGEPPLGLTIDSRGALFDAGQPSDMEHLLMTDPLDDAALLSRARGAMARIREAHLSKYSANDPALPAPEAGYVLVIDQTRGDASVRLGGADANSFREMLYYAMEDHPAARIVIKTHPETAAGHRAGYFGPQDAQDPQGRVTLLTGNHSPHALLEGAIAVYTVTSQMGFEAILAGHRPQVFGQPFYSGWGLSDERHPNPLTRRTRSLTRVQMFAAVMMLYPHWFDPYRGKACQIEEVIAALEAETRAHREDGKGWTASGMRLWKRRALQGFFGAQKPLRFTDTPLDEDRPHMVWGAPQNAPERAWHLEDGFLRSKGLGAALTAPLSLVLDDLGIYYDPTRESRLERMIHARADKLRPDQALRAERLMAQITKAGLSKYNLTRRAPDLDGLPDGPRILVPGQVEDDASIRLGTRDVATNLALLEAVRAARPDAVLLYKPHPDVEAGLRQGAVPEAALARLGAHPLPQSDPAALLGQVDEVWTMTSGLGFEALMRSVPVTCLGAPFYAGWGLTADLGPVPVRRARSPAQNPVSLAALVHAALIDYPRYVDPLTRRPCPPEVVAERLAAGQTGGTAPALRVLSKLQGLMASRAHWWR